jgi:hypothetical protein
MPHLRNRSRTDAGHRGRVGAGLVTAALGLAATACGGTVEPAAIAGGASRPGSSASVDPPPSVPETTVAPTTTVAPLSLDQLETIIVHEDELGPGWVRVDQLAPTTTSSTSGSSSPEACPGVPLPTDNSIAGTHRIYSGPGTVVAFGVGGYPSAGDAEAAVNASVDAEQSCSTFASTIEAVPTQVTQQVLDQPAPPGVGSLTVVRRTEVASQDATTKLGYHATKGQRLLVSDTALGTKGANAYLVACNYLLLEANSCISENVRRQFAKLP